MIDMKNALTLNYKFIILTLFCFCSIVLSAQNEYKLSSIKPGSKINYVIDFSHSIIMGLSETDFANYEKDWNKDKISIITKFQKGINNKLDGLLNIGTYMDSPYTLMVTVKNISDVGNIFCDVTITDDNGQILFAVKNVNGGAEPPFLPGTKLAKIKIWASLTGRSLGGILKSEYLDQ